jgi:hypothetical protein
MSFIFGVGRHLSIQLGKIGDSLALPAGRSAAAVISRYQIDMMEISDRPLFH